MCKTMGFVFQNRFVLCLAIVACARVGYAFRQDAGPQGILSVEAEHFSRKVSRAVAEWERLESGGASGGAAMGASPASDSVIVDSRFAEEAPALEYDVHFARSGTHYVWIRGWAPDRFSDSCHLGLDGQELSSADRISDFSLERWSWSGATLDGPRAVVEVSSPGTHTLHLWMRESGMVVDKIVLTTDAGFVPSGFGPEESSAGPISTGSDFDGDGKADVALFEPLSAAWTVSGSTQGEWTFVSPVAGTVALPGDYDGDGKTDFTVYDPAAAQWGVTKSAGGSSLVQFGFLGVIPVPADYDGDGITDIAVFDPVGGVWYLMRSTAGFTREQFGFPGVIPVPSDYDGDGRADLAVFDPPSGVWFLMQSRAGFRSQQFGFSAVTPVPADYDGDGKSDIAVYYLGAWYMLRSGSTPSFVTERFGYHAAEPVPDDYDGDGKADLAVHEPNGGHWHILGSTAGYDKQTWCVEGGVPVAPQFGINASYGLNLHPVECGRAPKRLIVFGDSVAVGAGASSTDKGWGRLLLKDLRRRFSPDLSYFNVATGGAATAQLADQRVRLQTELGFPVEGHSIVAVFIGGVDLASAYWSGDSLFGPWRQHALDNLSQHLDWLHDPLLFPDGVSVHVFFTFDPADGLDTDPWCFTREAPLSTAIAYWNRGLAELQAVKASEDQPFMLVDVFTPFMGHAHNFPLFGKEPWFEAPPCREMPCAMDEFGSCVHPVDAGHAAIRDAVLRAIDLEFP